MLQIELTEGAMFDQVESRHGSNGTEDGVDAINDLRALGVRVAIDDFGTGYSSLSYLKRWRVDYLKIDRSFIRDLGTDSNDHAIVGAIIAMAQHLKIKVIAEGVEGWSQLEMLRKLGCRYAQGYLFAEPAPASKCRDFLNGRPLGLQRRRYRSAESRQRLSRPQARARKNFKEREPAAPPRVTDGRASFAGGRLLHPRDLQSKAPRASHSSKPITHRWPAREANTGVADEPTGKSTAGHCRAASTRNPRRVGSDFSWKRARGAPAAYRNRSCAKSRSASWGCW